MGKFTGGTNSHDEVVRRMNADTLEGRRSRAGGFAGGHGGGNPYHDARGEFTTAQGASAAAREAYIVRGVDRRTNKVKATLVTNMQPGVGHKAALDIANRATPHFMATSSSKANPVTGVSFGGHSAALKASRTVDAGKQFARAAEARMGRAASPQRIDRMLGRKR